MNACLSRTFLERLHCTSDRAVLIETIQVYNVREWKSSPINIEIGGYHVIHFLTDCSWGNEAYLRI